jgi:soluble lytic murein transglycosylase
MKGFKKLLSVLIIFIVVAAILGGSARLIYPLKYKELVIENSIRFGLEPELVFAVIKVESDFKPEAESRKNAKGLMQLSDSTAAWGAQTLGLGEITREDIFDPEINITIGCWYLSILRNEFGHDTDLVLAAYNGGSGNVNQWLKDRSLSSTGQTLDRVPFPETERYIRKVNNCINMYKKLYENEF